MNRRELLKGAGAAATAVVAGSAVKDAAAHVDGSVHHEPKQEEIVKSTGKKEDAVRTLGMDWLIASLSLSSDSFGVTSVEIEYYMEENFEEMHAAVTRGDTLAVPLEFSATSSEVTKWGRYKPRGFVMDVEPMGLVMCSVSGILLS